MLTKKNGTQLEDSTASTPSSSSLEILPNDSTAVGNEHLVGRLSSPGNHLENAIGFTIRGPVAIILVMVVVLVTLLLLRFA